MKFDVKEKLPSLKANVASLATVQVSNYLLPLLTLPYLTRVLGVEIFGKVVFSQIVIGYALILINFGFSWSASRKISSNRNNNELLSKLFANTFVAQWLLLAFTAFVLLFLVLFFDRLRQDSIFFLSAYTSVIGVALFPTWFYEGMERLRTLAILQLSSRLLAVILTFAFVKDQNDGPLLLIINGVTSIFIGILSLLVIRHEGVISWNWPSLCMIGEVLKDGYVLFFSRLFISFYTNLVPLALGLLAGPAAMAYFNLADKLRSAAQSLVSPISQALFPRMSHLARHNNKDAFELMKSSSVLIIILSSASSIFLYVLSDWLIYLLGGEDFSSSSSVLKILSPLPLIIGLSNIFGVQIMVSRGMNREFNSIVGAGALVSVAIVWTMVEKFSASGAAATILIVEVFITTTMYLFLKRKGFFNFKNW